MNDSFDYSIKKMHSSFEEIHEKMNSNEFSWEKEESLLGTLRTCTRYIFKAGSYPYFVDFVDKTYLRGKFSLDLVNSFIMKPSPEVGKPLYDNSLRLMSELTWILNNAHLAEDLKYLNYIDSQRI